MVCRVGGFLYCCEGGLCGGSFLRGFTFLRYTYDLYRTVVVVQLSSTPPTSFFPIVPLCRLSSPRPLDKPPPTFLFVLGHFASPAQCIYNYFENIIALRYFLFYFALRVRNSPWAVALILR